MKNITIQDLEFRYNGTPVLSDINCEIEHGDFLAVVGPNGSGKSTLIRCINGFLKPRKGKVMVDCKDITDYTRFERSQKIAYVPQVSHKQMAISVFETVLLGRKPYIQWVPSAEDKEKTAQVIHELQLDDIASRDINKLSGGQQQMVYLARAIVQEPEILLLDEPSANLDLKHAIEFMDLLLKYCNGGMTVIVALHDINLAIQYASKILMLREGRIFAFGKEDIITEHNISKLYDINVRVIRENNLSHVIPLGTLSKTINKD